MINVVIKIQNGRGTLMEFCSIHNIKCNGVFDSGNAQYVYFYQGALVQSSPYGVPKPRHFHGIEATVSEFCDYYQKKCSCLVTTDYDLMPTSVGPDYQGKVRTTVTRDPEDPRKITSLHSKILPMANYYNTSAVLKTANEKETKEFVKRGSFEVLPFKVRLGLSEESVKLQMVRELDDTVDVDDVQFLIHEIF